MLNGFKIIDFHTHPFRLEKDNICSHKECFSMSAKETLDVMNALGVDVICGSVIHKIEQGDDVWGEIRSMNEEALALRQLYGERYIPGFHVHPDFVRESCEEIERMHKLGVDLVGELVPYSQLWKDYSCKGFSEILDVCEQYGMVVSFHSMGEDEMDAMVKAHPKVTFVAAHPGEYREFMRHMERMQYSENYYVDLSGYGIFRHGMLKHAVNQYGAERFLFGSDYPTCNMGMYIGGVLYDTLLTDAEKELIFSKNAERLLKI